MFELVGSHTRVCGFTGQEWNYTKAKPFKNHADQQEQFGVHFLVQGHFNMQESNQQPYDNKPLALPLSHSKPCCHCVVGTLFMCCQQVVNLMSRS